MSTALRKPSKFLRRLGKKPVKYQVDVCVIDVDEVPLGFKKLFAALSRGPHVAISRQADVLDRKASWNETLSITCTMFADPRTGKMENKVAALKIKEAEKKRQKVLGVVNIPLEEYCGDGVQHESKVFNVKYSPTKHLQLKLSITTQPIKRSGDAETASVMSEMTALSVDTSSDKDYSMESDDEMAGESILDVPDPAAASTEPPTVDGHGEQGAGNVHAEALEDGQSAAGDNVSQLRNEIASLRSRIASGKSGDRRERTGALHGILSEIRDQLKRDREESEKRRQAMKLPPSASGSITGKVPSTSSPTASASAGANMRAMVAKLAEAKVEKEVLKRKLHNLENLLAESQANSSARISELEEENESLRLRNRQLQFSVGTNSANVGESDGAVPEVYRNLTAEEIETLERAGGIEEIMKRIPENIRSMAIPEQNGGEENESSAQENQRANDNDNDDDDDDEKEIDSLTMKLHEALAEAKEENHMLHQQMKDQENRLLRLAVALSELKYNNEELTEDLARAIKEKSDLEDIRGKKREKCVVM